MTENKDRNITGTQSSNNGGLFRVLKTSKTPGWIQQTFEDCLNSKEGWNYKKFKGVRIEKKLYDHLKVEGMSLLENITNGAVSNMGSFKNNVNMIKTKVTNFCNVKYELDL